MKLMPLKKAVVWLLSMLKSILPKLHKDQVLALLGDVAALCVPFLGKEGIRKLGQALVDLDPDHEGFEDQLGEVFVAMGGGPVEQTIQHNPPIEVPSELPL